MSQSDDPLRELKSNRGLTLEQLSHHRPQLVVFLRHFGCTFCRESLSDLSSKRQQIEQLGFDLTLVHMATDQQAQEFFAGYGLDDVARISDRNGRLYHMFGLDRGGIRELFGLRVWLRGLWAALFERHGFGSIQADPFQMPGVYVYENGNLITGFQHRQASDRPDYLGIIAKAMRMQQSAPAIDPSATA